MDTNEALTQAWKEAKANETAWNQKRIEIESQIYASVQKDLPDKGTYTTEGGMKISIGFTEEWDQEELNAAYQQWPEGIKFPFVGVLKPDGKAITYLRENAPGAYSIIRPALTIRSKKPSFSIPDSK